MFISILSQITDPFTNAVITLVIVLSMFWAIYHTIKAIIQGVNHCYRIRRHERPHLPRNAFNNNPPRPWNNISQYTRAERIDSIDHRQNSHNTNALYEDITNNATRIIHSNNNRRNIRLMYTHMNPADNSFVKNIHTQTKTLTRAQTMKVKPVVPPRSSKMDNKIETHSLC